MGKKGGGRNSVPQRLHLSGACNESTGGMKRGGCVNLAVVPNESRSYFEEFLGLSGAVSMFATWSFFVRFERLCLSDLHLQCSKMCLKLYLAL